MLFFHALVRFTTHLSLEDVANLISKQLYGGIPFVVTYEFDEVPGVKLQSNILMLAVRICGKTPDFGLRIDTDESLYLSNMPCPKLDIVNISQYVEQALRGIDEIHLIPA